MNPTELMRKRRNGQAGFTLIELMIVIAIIGILAAVAIPNFLRARDKSMYSGCIETLSSIKLAQEMYITDNNCYASVPDRLAMYMISGCVERDGTDCAGEVTTRVKASVQGWDEITYNDCFDYEIHGTCKERFNCKICVTPAGYGPTFYDEDSCGLAWNAVCP